MLGNTETLEEDFTVARLYISKLKSEVKSLHTHNQTLEAALADNSSQLDAMKEQFSNAELAKQQVNVPSYMYVDCANTQFVLHWQQSISTIFFGINVQLVQKQSWIRLKKATFPSLF